MKALLPVFDETREKPYYLQLYSYIRELIMSGETTSSLSKVTFILSRSPATTLTGFWPAAVKLYLPEAALLNQKCLRKAALTGLNFPACSMILIVSTSTNGRSA